MRLLLNAGLILGGTLLLFVETGSARQPVDCGNTVSSADRGRQSAYNNWQRRRGRWYSRGYHYNSPGCSPFENWDPYQDFNSANGSDQKPAYRYVAPVPYPETKEPTENQQQQSGGAKPADGKTPGSVVEPKNESVPTTPKRPNRNSEGSPSDLKAEPKKVDDGGNGESRTNTTVHPPVRSYFRRTSAR